YVLARPFWGRGYMTEAVRALIRAALADPWIFRVWAFCDVENLASARVMEKAGMSFEGRLRRWTVHPNVGPEPRDVLCYAKVR
ncbi:MAG: GNAT family N-acetyltransferase, partial [Geminicoccaceae bacterium]